MKYCITMSIDYDRDMPNAKTGGIISMASKGGEVKLRTGVQLVHASTASGCPGSSESICIMRMYTERGEKELAWVSSHQRPSKASKSRSASGSSAMGVGAGLEVVHSNTPSTPPLRMSPKSVGVLTSAADASLSVSFNSDSISANE